jgi:protein TonB
MEQLDVKYKTDYGASELKKIYRKYLGTALIIGMVFHLCGVGAYWGIVYATTETGPTNTVRLIVKYSDLGPPPSLSQAMAAAVTAASAGVKPSVGIPVPVPDAEVSPEQTIATQQELSQQTAPIDQGPTGGGEKEIKIEEDEAPPADYVPYEKAPEAVKQVQPKYPDLATRAGLEGTVWVKIWVDKEGKPKKAVVQKSDAEIFNQPAAEAAMQWVFTPAMMKNGPVSVWVSIPFRFKLQGK